MYGKELIIDLHTVSPNFTKKDIENYFVELCKEIDMERVRVEWWEGHGYDQPHLNGISAVQFITTSNITIHYATELGQVHLNIFSCKEFDGAKALDFTCDFFGGKLMTSTVVERL